MPRAADAPGTQRMTGPGCSVALTPTEPPAPRSRGGAPWQGDAVALVATALALALRAALDPWLGDSLTLVTLYGAVAFAVWRGGLRAALLATVLGYLGADYLFVSPRGAIGPWDAPHLIGLFAYLASCAPIVAFGVAYQRAAAQAEARRVQLEHEVGVRRAAEDAERSQRERLRLKLASIADGVIATDLHGRITSINPAAEALTGWRGADAVGLDLDAVFRIVDEPTRRPLANPARRAIAAGAPTRQAEHTLLLARDGRERPIDGSVAPVRDTHGALVGAVLVFRDVSLARRAAAVDARLAALVRHSHDAIVSTGRDGRIDVWNPAAERIFGWRAAEVIGQSVAFYVPPERGDEQRALIARALAGETVSAETQRLTKTGERIDVLLRITPMLDADGQIAGHAGSLQDISARKRAEAALRDSETTLRAFYDNAPVCMGVVEPCADGDVLHLYDNPVACRVFGVEPGTTAGRRATELGAARETLEVWHAHYAASERSGRPESFDFQLALPDGRRWFSATVAAIGPGPEGRMRFSYVCEDTTERHRAAARLRESEAQARLALQVAQAGTWSWDTADDAVGADARCREIVDLAPQAALRLADVLPRVQAEDRPRVEAALRASAAAGAPFAAEFRVVRGDGGLRWVAARGQMLPPPTA